MQDPHFLTLIPPAEKQETSIDDRSDSLARFKGVVLNLTESAWDCLNRISQREMQKESLSPTLMEDYFLLHHYLDFIKTLCQGVSV
jgi:hypothetical protein